MADVTKGGSTSQIDVVSSSDVPTAVPIESAPGSTNGDARCSILENAVPAVTSSTSTKPRSYFPLRSSLLGTSSASSSSMLSSTTSATTSLAAKSTSSKGFTLNPPRLSNPFAKPDKTDDTRPSTLPTAATAEDVVGSSTSRSGVSFVPLGGEPAAPSAPNSMSQTPVPTPSFGFVFGQNIHEKVVEASSTAEGGNCTSNNDSGSSKDDNSEVTSNGTTSEMLFSAHVKKDIADKAEHALDSGGKTLSEAAREYEEARAVKRKFEEVQVITGEEEESNVIQINCKLFSWSSSTWVERGRGTLRVNDFPSNPSHHRLIVRSAGSLRLVLNTNIWSGMTVDRASNKSMRITAMDSNEVVKVFLIMASPKEIDQLQKCLEGRVNNLKKSEPVGKKKAKEEDLPPPLDDRSFSD